jgi:Predicted phosphatase homologous to the C-terminal domain of histone macroH2A1
VAFPAISAGVYGWDADEVARIAVAAVRGSSHLAELDLVRFVLFSPATREAFITALG